MRTRATALRPYQSLSLLVSIMSVGLRVWFVSPPLSSCCFGRFPPGVQVQCSFVRRAAARDALTKHARGGMPCFSPRLCRVGLLYLFVDFHPVWDLAGPPPSLERPDLSFRTHEPQAPPSWPVPIFNGTRYGIVHAPLRFTSKDAQNCRRPEITTHLRSWATAPAQLSRVIHVQTTFAGGSSPYPSAWHNSATGYGTGRAPGPRVIPLNATPFLSCTKGSVNTTSCCRCRCPFGPALRRSSPTNLLFSPLYLEVMPSSTPRESDTHGLNRPFEAARPVSFCRCAVTQVRRSWSSRAPRHQPASAPGLLRSAERADRPHRAALLALSGRTFTPPACLGAAPHSDRTRISNKDALSLSDEGPCQAWVPSAIE